MNQTDPQRPLAAQAIAPRRLRVSTLFTIVGNSLRTRFPSVFTRTFKWVFLCSLPLHLFAQYFVWIGQIQDDRLQLISAIGSALVSLAASSVMIMIVPPVVVAGWGTRKGPPPVPAPTVEQMIEKVQLGAHFGKQIGPLAIESMRMLPKGLVLTMLLIVPGIYYFIRMSFLPYLVQFSAQYSKGKIDMLKYSYEISKGVFFPVLVLAVMTGALQYALLSLTGAFSVWTQPVIFGALFMVNIPASIAVEVVWTSVFLELFEGADDELVFSVA